MQITNTTKARLVLATGEVVEAGAAIDAPSFDDKHVVMKAWIDAGLIEVAKPTAKNSKSGAKNDKD